jgi:hypothetical protein
MLLMLLETLPKVLKMVLLQLLQLLQMQLKEPLMLLKMLDQQQPILLQMPLVVFGKELKMLVDQLDKLQVVLLKELHLEYQVLLPKHQVLQAVFGKVPKILLEVLPIKQRVFSVEDNDNYGELFRNSF